jgi:hypothetical protein
MARMIFSFPASGTCRDWLDRLLVDLVAQINYICAGGGTGDRAASNNDNVIVQILLLSTCSCGQFQPTAAKQGKMTPYSIAAPPPC